MILVSRGSAVDEAKVWNGSAFETEVGIPFEAVWSLVLDQLAIFHSHTTSGRG